MPLINITQRVKEGQKKPTRYYSSKQEKKVAQDVGGQTTISSGSTPFSKGDAMTNDNLYLIECKTKTKDSEQFTIHKEWLEKNEREALFMGKKSSVLAFNFGPNQKNYYIIDENDFLEFIEWKRQQ